MSRIQSANPLIPLCYPQIESKGIDYSEVAPTPFFQLQRLDDLCEFPYAVIDAFHSVNWNYYLDPVATFCGLLESPEVRVGVHFLIAPIEIDDTSLSLHYKIVFGPPKEFETQS